MTLLMNEFSEFVDPEPEPRLLKLAPVDMDRIRAEVRQAHASQLLYDERRCKCCGKVFQPRTSTQAYCSEKCRSRWHSKMRVDRRK